MRETCACGAAQNGSACGCGILQRGVVGHDFFEGTETTNGAETWRNAAQTLAADNARLCAIALAADKLAEAAAKHDASFHPEICPSRERAALKAALDAYKIARNGQ